MSAFGAASGRDMAIPVRGAYEGFVRHQLRRVVGPLPPNPRC
jgi:hypothetical protein